LRASATGWSLVTELPAFVLRVFGGKNLLDTNLINEVFAL